MQREPSRLNSERSVLAAADPQGRTAPRARTTHRAAEMAGVVGTDHETEDKGECGPAQHEIAQVMGSGSPNAVIVNNGEADQAEERTGGTDHRHDRMPPQAGSGCRQRRQGVQGGKAQVPISPSIAGPTW